MSDNYRYEYYCPHCEAILNKQKGFSDDIDTWVCQECGQVLMSEGTSGDFFEDVLWYCDECGILLNTQEGFTETERTWTCKECGHENKIAEEEIIVPANKVM